MSRFKILFPIALMAAMVFMSCQKDNLVTDVPHNETPDFDWGKGTEIPIVSFFNFQGKIDSQLYVLQDTIDGYENIVLDSGYAKCDAQSVFFGQTAGLVHASGVNSLYVNILDCVADTTDSMQKLGIVREGTYAYGSSAPLAKSVGVEVKWVDATGKIWSTYPGSGSSTDDSFVIQSINPNPSAKDGAAMITGVMRLTLYNGTESIKIENGVFNLLIGKI